MKELNIHIEKGIKLRKRFATETAKIASDFCDGIISFLEINFVSSKKIIEINKKFLNHDYPTDVISFDYSDENNSFDGEIFICYDIALENSKRFNVSLDNELKRLIIHGMLHLVGFDDQSPSQKRKMKKFEDEILARCKSIAL